MSGLSLCKTAGILISASQIQCTTPPQIAFIQNFLPTTVFEFESYSDDVIFQEERGGRRIAVSMQQGIEKNQPTHPRAPFL